MDFDLLQDRHYIRDIVCGMVPRDNYFNDIMDLMEKNHIDDVDEIWIRSASEIRRLADDVRTIIRSRNV